MGQDLNLSPADSPGLLNIVHPAAGTEEVALRAGGGRAPGAGPQLGLRFLHPRPRARWQAPTVPPLQHPRGVSSNWPPLPRPSLICCRQKLCLLSVNFPGLSSNGPPGRNGLIRLVLFLFLFLF